MGDMADMALSETMDMEDLRLQYRHGGMRHQQAYDEGIIDEHGAEPVRTIVKTCRYCGANGLRWSLVANGWRLISAAGIHNCFEFARSKLNGQRT